MKLDPQRLRSAHSTRMLYSVSHPRAAVWRSDSEIAEVRRVLRKNSGRMLRILRCFFLLKLFPTRLPNMNGLSYLSYLQKSLQSCILTHFRSSVIQLYLSHVYSCFWSCFPTISKSWPVFLKVGKKMRLSLSLDVTLSEWILRILSSKGQVLCLKAGFLKDRLTT